MCGFCAKSYKRTAKERQGIYQLLISIICNALSYIRQKCGLLICTRVNRCHPVESQQRPENIAMYIYIVKPDIHTT